MASAKTKLQLQERVRLPRTAWKLADLAVLFLLLALLARRASSLVAACCAAPACTWCWVAALICEAWFTVVWLININAKWNPVRFDTHPERLAQRTSDDELPAVDMFVTTADPKLEPPLVTVNTVLSLLALDYPAGKLTCYVSDDGCSAVTCYALREAAEFAKLWVPFCKKYGVGVRAPFVYFSSGAAGATADAEFLRAWTLMKNEYEELVRRIENAEEDSLVRRGDGEFAEFVGADRRNHPTIIKVLWDSSSKSKSNQAADDGIPSLIYVSREKSPTQHHHFKAGAMNVLTRVSAVVTNAPITLNVDCDMFANNPQVALHAMCLLLGFDDELHSGFVQAPQKFYGGLKDDPFGNQMQVIYELIYIHNFVVCAVSLRRKLGLEKPDFKAYFTAGQGAFTVGKSSTACHQTPPPPSASKHLLPGFAATAWSYMHVLSIAGWLGVRVDDRGHPDRAANPRRRLEDGVVEPRPAGIPRRRAHRRTGQPHPVQEVGHGPAGILLSRHNPFLLAAFKHLDFRQCVAYLFIDVWAIRAPFELCYALLGPYCIIANHSFLPKASEPGFVIPLALFLAYNAYNLGEYKDCRLSARAWWNNHRMQRIVSSSAWLLAFLTVVLKTVGLSETVFEVTRKEQQSSSDGDAGDGADDADLGRFTFDSSPVFVPPTALAMLSIVAVAVGAWRVVAGAVPAAGGPGAGELVCCGWLVLCFWPFVRGLVGRGSYGIPWSVRLKAALLVAAFVHLSTRKLLSPASEYAMVDVTGIN
ncbi:unnamed protein product [Miscanthus lutarioriparius]|uniref:Cellulose synthase-like protein H1 n=1 Tax=Miscanthus lutarioriparius TaxID=422564 RepID=A0A811QPK0_9POAL|nr:unnamed protein product [Miscanthus lutarioriparius]